MSRWKKYVEVWNEMPGYTLVIGVAASGFDETIPMMSGGMHSEYMRLLFFTGLFGLVVYVLFLLFIVLKTRWLLKTDRYLVIGVLLALLLHSISTTPFLYASYTSLLVIVFAFVLLPQKILNEQT